MERLANTLVDDQATVRHNWGVLVRPGVIYSFVLVFVAVSTFSGDWIILRVGANNMNTSYEMYTQAANRIKRGHYAYTIKKRELHANGTKGPWFTEVREVINGVEKITVEDGRQ